MLHATLKNREGLGTRLGEANVVHMKMGVGGHAYFKFTDELRFGGDHQCPRGTACSRHGWSEGTGYSGTNGTVRGDHLLPIQMVRGDRLWGGTIGSMTGSEIS